MTDKALTYARRSEDHAREIASSYWNWTSFLRTASQVYKYSYADQLMIHMQRPDATACASYEVWNQRMHRYIRRGRSGILLLNPYNKLAQPRYVFDISDTGSKENAVPFSPWALTPENEPFVSNALATHYDVPAGIPLVTQIEMISAALTRDYWQNLAHDFAGIVDGTPLAEYDEGAVGSSFRRAAAASTIYSIMTRCGMDADKHLTPEDLHDVQYFTTPYAIGAVGSAVSINSSDVLRHIESTIREYERSIEHGETDLHPVWRLPDSGHSLGSADNSAGEVRRDAQGLSGEASPRPVERPADDREAVRAPVGDRPAGRAALRNDDAPAQAAIGRDRGAEEAGSDEVGADDEQHPSPDRGVHPDRTGLQLSLFEISFPTEEQQIDSITQAESAPAPFAFPVAQEDIDHILRTGDNTSRHRLMIVSEFSKGKTPEELVPILKRIYHGGNGIITDNGRISAWYAEDGIHLSKGNAARYVNTAHVVPWNDVAVRIAELLESGNFATNLEIAEAPGHERHMIAQHLWYITRDLSEKAIEAGYLPTLRGIRGGGYTEETARIADQIATPEQYAVLADEVSSFYADYQADRSLMRFRLPYIADYAVALDEYSMPRIDYESQLMEIPEVGRFITEDEVDAVLANGQGSYAGGGLRIYSFFRESHTDSERVDLLKREYGIGGHAPAISGASHSSEDHDGKGIKLQKAGCEPVLLKWNKVAKRIDALIRQGRYLSSEQMAEWQAQQEMHDEPAETLEEATEQPILPVNEPTPEPVQEADLQSEAPTMNQTEPAPRPYLVVAYHHFEGGFDEKLDYATLEDAETAAQGYVDGTMEEDGFQYDGAAVYNQQEKRYLRVYGDYPDARAIEQAAGEPDVLNIPVEDPLPPMADTPYHVGDMLYLDDQPFAVDSIGLFDVHLRDPNATYPILRAESKERLAVLLALDSRNSAYLSPQETTSEIAASDPPVIPDEPPQQPVITIESVPTTQIIPENYHINDEHLGEGGAKAKFHANVEAIRVLKELEAEDRPATTAEQEILARYVGWGGLPDAFDDSKPAWASEYTELRNLLSHPEYEAARASTLNAHYTSPTVIRAIYETVERMGFTTGNILEPAMGVGNFFGMLPESMSASRLYGVELDSITGRIAQKLYPHADITVAGFETTDRRDFFDLAIGNVPFGNYQVNDPAYNKLGFSIHDYFFAKTLDQVRPGGVIAFVTSRYTMDKQSPEVRRYIAQRAELLGAVRLPNNAFKANAGTDVVSDIIFLQKRDRPIEIDPDWVHLGNNPDGFAINSYFVDHPEMILGAQASTNTQYGKQDFTVEPIEGASLAVQMASAMQSIRGVYTPAELPDLDEGETLIDRIPADPNIRNYSYTIVEGQVYYRENSMMIRSDLSETAQSRIKGMVALRDCVRKLIDLQMTDAPEDVIKAQQATLNELYDSFTAKHGLISTRANAKAFDKDSSYFLLTSLENVNENGELVSKADMFTKRTIRPQRVIEHVETASEALAVSIAERARVDLHYMAQLTGMTEMELRDIMSRSCFRLPGTEDTYVTADEYLSGNVREKLREARLAAAADPSFTVNVEALESAQPQDLTATEIDVRLGATWVKPEYVEEFMYELLNTPSYLRRSMHVQFSPITAEWNISSKTAISSSNVAAYITYGTERASAYKILEDTLNLRDTRIFDVFTGADGKEQRVLNQKETMLAQQKQQAIKDAFRDWVWRDPERRHDLVQTYNERFNSIRPREYDGQFITFGGMNPEIELREHQRNAVAHILYGGNTLLAHEVGAGKTFEMIAAAMESRRLGLCNKCMFVVPNHLTEQWASEFMRLYPSANILVTTKRDFETSRRKKFCARIATGDYDAIIIGHSQFERIPISHERQERILQEQIDEITEGIYELRHSIGERYTVKQMEKIRRQLEVRLRKLQAEGKKDDVVTFEELGVDRLFVDEAHAYKNLFLQTKMRNVAGLSTSEAQKSSDMFAKCRYMDEITGGRGVVFATGTPVSNSMTELYTMQRYLQYSALQKNGLTHFDCWASTFGESTTAIELAPEGTGYRARTRFAKFFNLPELMTLFKEVADIKTADQLHLPTPTAHYETIAVKPTEQQQEMVQALSERASLIHTGSVDPHTDNMLKVTSDGRKLGLDQRLVNPLLPDDPSSKVNACVENIFRIWTEGSAERLTQLVFCDISTPKGSTDPTQPSTEFSVYDDIRTKLIDMGIPPEQIAFIHDANTELRKKELFAKVNAGDVRVLIGSTAKMGAGTNVQTRLVAIHDVDCPWRPGDLEQRAGRIVRQGNQNKDVHIYRYVTEGTFDSYLWQTVENKQRFISQIMTSRSPVRSCDDIDETALSYAEIKALCAGDPRIKERMDLDVTVSRLRIMKSDHQSKQFHLEDQLLRYFPAAIAQAEQQIECFQHDMATLAAYPTPEKDFVGITIRGKFYEDRIEAGKAIIAACKLAAHERSVEVGEYRGLSAHLSYDSFANHFVMTLQGKMHHVCELGNDPRGNMIRVDNVLASIPARMDVLQSNLANLHVQQAAARQELGKPFPQEEELRVSSARLAELDCLLNIDTSPVTAAAEEHEAKAARPSLREQLKAPIKPTTPKRPPSQEAR